MPHPITFKNLPSTDYIRYYKCSNLNTHTYSVYIYNIYYIYIIYIYI